jgi:ribosomal protein S27E
VATKLKVTCPDCGHVRLPTDEVRLVVGPGPRGSFYRFRCPDCGGRVRRPAPEPVVATLLERGVPAIRVA